MNPAELDRCRVSTEPTSFGSSLASSGSSFGSSRNTGTGAQQANPGDATAWQNAVNSVEGSLFGGGNGGGTSNPPPSSNRPTYNNNLDPQPAIQIQNARVLSRESIQYARIDVDPNSLNSAVMYTKGYVFLDILKPRGRRMEPVRYDSLWMDLTYSLSSSYRGWQCNQVSIDTRILDDDIYGPGGGSYDRIGW